MLYQAYMNGTLKLFPTDDWEETNSSSTIYLRSDDEQRTLMSGQILLHGMFNVSDSQDNENLVGLISLSV